MRISLIILVSLFSCVTGYAQTKGVITDGETNQPLYLVNILDLTNSQSAYSDERGIYSINAQNGDLLSFYYSGYHTIQRIAATDSIMHVSMLTLNVHLKEYILHPEYTPFQQDSAELAALYSDQLNPKPTVQPGFSTANGGGFTGLIGSAVQKVSHSYKQKKKFKKNFEADEEQKYIDTRYTPQLVSSLTGLSGDDTLAMFMNAYPMEYKFARNASDLELKIWIRDNYREYLLSPKRNTLALPAKKED